MPLFYAIYWPMLPLESVTKKSLMILTPVLADVKIGVPKVDLSGSDNFHPFSEAKAINFLHL